MASGRAMVLVGLLTAGLAIALPPSKAADQPADKPCADLTQQEMQACLQAMVTFAEGDLAEKRQQIRAVLAKETPERRTQLLTRFNSAEESWDGARAVFCDGMMGEYRKDESFQAETVLGCHLDQLNSRVNFLDDQFHHVLH